MNACYQAGGHTDLMEYEWLRQVLAVPENDMMALTTVTPQMAEVDKLLIPVFRRKNWMPSDLIRKLNSIENELVRQIPITGTITGQLIWWMIHNYLKAMPGMRHLCNITHLYSIEWMGDTPGRMKQFLTAWEYVI